MGRENKFLITILIVLTVGVWVTGALVAYLAIARQQEDVGLTEPEEDLAMLLTPLPNRSSNRTSLTPPTGSTTIIELPSDVASSELQQLTPGEVHDGIGAWSP